jgi:hypothetical protein
VALFFPLGLQIGQLGGVRVERAGGIDGLGGLVQSPQVDQRRGAVALPRGFCRL